MFAASELLPFECEQCGETFLNRQKDIKSSLKRKKDYHKFCSIKCLHLSQEKLIITKCSNCNKRLHITPAELKKSKSGRSFCNSSCAATYNNKNKTTGNRRSKFEIFVEQELKIRFPNLEIVFNDKSAVNSELDIFIPSLNLAFELNGIYHYQPIHGKKKFQSIKNNDKLKKQSCSDKNIKLIVINISAMNKFSKIESLPYLDKIIKKIEQAKENVLRQMR